MTRPFFSIDVIPEGHSVGVNCGLVGARGLILGTKNIKHIQFSSDTGGFMKTVPSVHPLFILSIPEYTGSLGNRWPLNQLSTDVHIWVLRWVEFTPEVSVDLERIML